jgi:hypothetical protein
LRGRGMGANLRSCVKEFHTTRHSEAAPGTLRGWQKLLRLKGFRLVGLTGFEPATSWSRIRVKRPHRGSELPWKTRGF